MALRLLALLLVCSFSCSGASESAAERTQHTINCDHIIGTTAEVNPNRTIVGDVVAFTTTRTLQLGSRDLDFVQYFFSKDGLVVRVGSAFEILIPEGSANRIRWGFRDETGPVQRVIVPACKALDLRDDLGRSTDPWIAFSGGYWVEEANCVELIVRIPDQEDTIVHIGVGTPCDGVSSQVGVATWGQVKKPRPGWSEEIGSDR